MATKLTTSELKKKASYHKKRQKFYDKKVKDSKKNDQRIGFKI